MNAGKDGLDSSLTDGYKRDNWVSGVLKSFDSMFGENVVMSVDVYPVWCSVRSLLGW